MFTFLNDLDARERFLHILDWMLALELRHAAALEPGLVRISYDHLDVHEMTYSASDAAEKLGEVLVCLQQAFRSTDIIARDGLNFWILAPFTQSDPVIDKVRHVLQTAPQKGLAIARSDISIFFFKDHLTAENPKFTTGRDFLNFLLLRQTPKAPS